MSLKPLNSSNSLGQNFNQVNDMVRQLNREQTVKTFKQPGGNSIVIGQLPFTGGQGILIYDSDNIPRILIGIAPDGLIDIAQSEDGVDITTLYS